MKVITKDFQILKGTIEWELPVGLTIIQGPSGNGKTSFIYALEYALTNPSGVDDVINWDAKQTEVTIENNGAKVKWIKTSNSSEYVNELTGQSYVKASKLDSRDIGDLGFYFDAKDRVINIHDEWCLLFPFSSSDAEMFKLFDDMFNVSSSFKIIEEIKNDEKDIKQQISNIDKDINSMKKINLEIDGILNSLSEDEVEAQINQLNSTQTAYTELNNDFNIYENNIQLKDVVLPKEFKLHSLETAYSHYSQINNDYNDYLANLSLLSYSLPEKEFNLFKPTIIDDYEIYSQLLSDINSYTIQLNELDLQTEELNKKLSTIKVCPTCGRPLDECED